MKKILLSIGKMEGMASCAAMPDYVLYLDDNEEEAFANWLMLISKPGTEINIFDAPDQRGL